MKKNRNLRGLLLALSPLLLFYACGEKHEEHNDHPTGDEIVIKPDDVLFSFVFMGCNRLQDTDTGKVGTNATTANVPELQRTFNEVCALNPKPSFYFFLGDLVLALDSTTRTMETQLTAWKKQYYDKDFSPLATSGIRLIAIPGNHEMLFERKGTELPLQPAMDVWMKLMRDFMPEGKINRVTGPDSLLNLQTYSFDYQDTHFIMLNTDTYTPGAPMQPGLSPAAWIAEDIKTARQNKAIKHIFLMGHKPCFVDDGEKEDEEMDSTVTKVIWPAMEENHAEAMLSAHSHQYYRTQPNAGKSYQIISGNGGSRYAAHIGKEHEFFGYSIVYVMKNGKVILKNMGRSVPRDKYFEAIPSSLPTTQRDLIDMSWGTTAPVWKIK